MDPKADSATVASDLAPSLEPEAANVSEIPTGETSDHQGLREAYFRKMVTELGEG